MNRRTMIGNLVKGGLAAVAAPAFTRVAAGASMVNRGAYRLFGGSDKVYSSRAVDLVQRSIVVDMLAPLWISPSVTQKMLGNP
jgi:hypothetical protein